MLVDLVGDAGGVVRLIELPNKIVRVDLDGRALGVVTRLYVAVDILRVAGDIARAIGVAGAGAAVYRRARVARVGPSVTAGAGAVRAARKLRGVAERIDYFIA